MEIQSPFYLFLLILIPFLLFWYQKNGKKNEAVFFDFLKAVFIRKNYKFWKKKNILLKSGQLLSIFLIIVGLSRPQLIDKITETSVEVVDMILVLDISSSMLADDFQPNRLEAVKKTAVNFINSRKSDRIGIIVFAGESFIQCPLTVDKSVLKSLIDEINIVSKEYDGTAIGMAIANATNRLRKS